MEETQTYTQKAIDYILEVAPSIVQAILMIIIGLWIINKLMVHITKAIKMAGLPVEIVSFLTSLVSIGLKVLLFFSVAGVVGINTASFVAVLAAAGFAVGMALQGSLGNFAAGIIIIFFKPYKIGDWVEIQDKFGKVEDIQIFNTMVGTPGQKQLIIPNGEVISGIVTNFSVKGMIRMEMQVYIPYEESFPKIKSMLLDSIATIDKVLKSPPVEIGIISFESHSVLIEVRPYVLPDDYWEVYFQVNEMIKATFHDNQIKVAYSEGVELGSIGA